MTFKEMIVNICEVRNKCNYCRDIAIKNYD